MALKVLTRRRPRLLRLLQRHDCSRRSTVVSPSSAERRETQVVKEGFPVFMVALIKLLIQSYGKLIHDVLLIVEMGGEAMEDEDLAVGVPTCEA